MGLHLQGHFYPGVPSHKHCHPARWLQSLLSEEVKPQAAPLGLSSPHLGNLLTQEATCPSATPPKQSSPNHLTSSKFQCAPPSFHAFLFNLSKHSAPNYCDVWGFFFFEQQVTKASFSFLGLHNKSCSGTCRALPATGAPAPIWYQTLSSLLTATALLEKPLQRDDKGIQMLKK